MAQRSGSLPPSPRTVKSDPLRFLEERCFDFGCQPSSAQRRWSLSHTSGAVKFPPLSSVAVRSLDFVQVLGSEALARPWRNEGGIYHTPSRLSNPCHRALTTLRHLALSGARPSTAQRGATIPSFHDPVKSGRGCSWIPRVLNDIGRKGVPGFRPGAQMGNDAGLVYTSAWHVNSAERSSFTWAMWRIFILIRGALRNAQVSGAKLAGHARINTLRGPPGYRADTRSPQVRPQCQFLRSSGGAATHNHRDLRSERRLDPAQADPRALYAVC